MKKLFLIFISVIFMLSGCFTSRIPDELIDKSDENDQKSGLNQVVNPIESVSDSAALFDATGISLDAPEAAEDVSYAVIGGVVAQVKFTYADMNCTLRASKETSGQALHGLYYDVESTQQLEIGGIFVTFDSFVGSESALSWEKDGVNFALTPSSALDTDTATALAALFLS